MLPTLRKDLTATAAHSRSAVLCLAMEGQRSSLRAAVPATYSWPTQNNFGGICRMPSVPLALDPSKQQEEGRP